MSFTMETITRPEATVVALIGAADLSGVELFQREMTKLCAIKPARLVFDLSQLTVISSICMGTMTAYRRGCAGWNGTVALTAPIPLVEQALRRARLDMVFEMAPSVEAALHPSPSTTD